MRFTLHDLDISLNVSVSALLYDSKATTTIQLEDLMLFLRGSVDKYSSVFKTLSTFDCGGYTIMEDWVRHVSYEEYNSYTYPYINKSIIVAQLQTDYSSALVSRTSKISSVRKYLYDELYTQRRCSFKAGDVLLYRTTISPYDSTSIIPSKRYLMQVIIT